ncbi:MAG TPA: hypothetical protein VML95_05070, partial [Longimicrobiales bacterium]|nr:hypothetical protein [Longimicrobiales bacterium]
MRSPCPIWPAVALALAAIAAVVQFSLPLNFDVSWYLYGAGRLLDGATPYVDWVEPNPPLIVWLSLPFQVLAGWTGLSAQSLLRVGGLFVVAASLALSAACLRQGPAEEHGVRDALLMVMAFALLSVVGHHFFQREHVFLAATLPYTCAASVRARGLPLGRALAIAVGAVAAVGLALKPFYVLVWLAVETLLAWRRTPRAALRAENVAIVVVGLLYGIAILIWAAAYLEIARMGARAYRSYASDVATTQILLDPRALGSYALVAFAIALRRRYPASGLRLVLLAMLLGYIAA